MCCSERLGRVVGNSELQKSNSRTLLNHHIWSCWRAHQVDGDSGRGGYPMPWTYQGHSTFWYQDLAVLADLSLSLMVRYHVSMCICLVQEQLGSHGEFTIITVFSVVRFTYNAAITLAVNKLVYAYNKYITLTPEHKLSMNSNWILSIEWAILHRTQTKEMQVGIHYHGFLLLHILLGYSVTQSEKSVVVCHCTLQDCTGGLSVVCWTMLIDGSIHYMDLTTYL